MSALLIIVVKTWEKMKKIKIRRSMFGEKNQIKIGGEFISEKFVEYVAETALKVILSEMPEGMRTTEAVKIIVEKMLNAARETKTDTQRKERWEMKRVIAACIDLTLEFDSVKECDQYAKEMDERKQEFRTLEREELPGDRIRVRIQKQYNKSPFPPVVITGKREKGK